PSGGPKAGDETGVFQGQELGILAARIELPSPALAASAAASATRPKRALRLRCRVPCIATPSRWIESVVLGGCPSLERALKVFSTRHARDTSAGEHLSFRPLPPGRRGADPRAGWPADRRQAQDVRHPAPARPEPGAPVDEGGAARRALAGHLCRGEQPRSARLPPAQGARRRFERRPIHRDGAEDRVPVPTRGPPGPSRQPPFPRPPARASPPNSPLPPPP